MTSGDELRSLLRSELNRGNPVVVGVERKDLLAEDVPELGSTITRGRSDDTVVSGKSARHDVTSVTSETDTGVVLKAPKTETSVPRGREDVLTISGESNVLDNVVVAVERTVSKADLLLLGSQTPSNDGLVTRAGDEDIGVLGGDSKGGDPAAVAFKGATEFQSFEFAHFVLPIRSVVDEFY